MIRTKLRNRLGAAVAAALLAACAAPALAVEIRPAGDLFYNYYSDNLVGNPAKMYPCPRPTPEYVGHTYFTYQPLLPHEFLRRPHAKVYTRLGPLGLPQNRTTVLWW